MFFKEEGRALKYGVEWHELSNISQAGKLADRLEEYREEYIQSLYDDIRLFSYPMGDYLTAERQESPDTAFQAMEIISKKEAYDKRIEKLKRQYSQWQDVLNQFHMDDAATLRGYFEEGEHSFRIEPLMPKVAEILDKQHKAMEKQLDKQAERKAFLESIRKSIPVYR
ncbi:hypothetical protein BEP19_15700 [Ammoniphilus oxalaticus]|uniref:Uncharacterized protein n=1 Tax=Ammoniphilus oxalaticus TaxID=66863 RepID=A0A419SDU3_9BACL|nr:hypothetical protein [Ammoniphilus oxalaticus]RKD21117.1 hypothetical protein BEP19_15700 [Ammoniphilus oxalaticus]